MAETFKQARSRYLSGTYKACPVLKSRLDIVRKWGTSRAKMVRWLTDNSGYSSRHQRYALEWNVAAYRADTSYDRMDHWIKELQGVMLDVEPCNMDAFRMLARRLHEESEDQMWEWGVDDARRAVTEDDCYTSTFTGLTDLPVTYRFEGRGGKHLCMDTFRNINLHQSGDDLEADLMEKDDDGDWTISHAHVIELFLLCVEAQVCFTVEAASAEVEHMAWTGFFANTVIPEWEAAQ